MSDIGLRLFQQLKGIDPEVSRDDYFDEESRSWDVEGLEEDLKVAQDRIHKTAPNANNNNTIHLEPQINATLNASSSSSSSSSTTSHHIHSSNVLTETATLNDINHHNPNPNAINNHHQHLSIQQSQNQHQHQHQQEMITNQHDIDDDDDDEQDIDLNHHNMASSQTTDTNPSQMPSPNASPSIDYDANDANDNSMDTDDDRQQQQEQQQVIIQPLLTNNNHNNIHINDHHETAINPINALNPINGIQQTQQHEIHQMHQIQQIQQIQQETHLNAIQGIQQKSKSKSPSRKIRTNKSKKCKPSTSPALKRKNEWNGESMNGMKRQRIDSTESIMDGVVVDDDVPNRWNLAALKKLHSLKRQVKNSAWFWEPVDEIRHSAPNYYLVCPLPADYGTICKKLEELRYNDLDNFLRDCELVFINARLYNTDVHPVHKSSMDLEKKFKELMDTFVHQHCEQYGSSQTLFYWKQAAKDYKPFAVPCDD